MPYRGDHLLVDFVALIVDLPQPVVPSNSCREVVLSDCMEHLEEVVVLDSLVPRYVYYLLVALMKGGAGGIAEAVAGAVAEAVAGAVAGAVG